MNAGRIEDGVIQCVYDAMQEFNTTNLFHSAKVVETYKNVAFQTEVVRVGTFADVVLNINSNFFGGLYDELSDIHISGISPTAMQDGTELVAEIGVLIGVLIERGEYDSVPEEAKIIFEKYLGG